jgi:RnfABCDGE-type electron transport complex B subunit
MEILYSIIALGGLGIIFGVGLSLAGKKFCVSSDPKLEKIQDNLPGANCGACGMAGCSGLAEALADGKCGIDKCTVANEESKAKIAKIMGVEFKKSVKKAAVLHCSGGVKVKERFLYHGIEDCVAANLVLKGQKSCAYGCLGFGNCVKACPFGAIKISKEEGLPIIDIDKCKACNKCVIACPKKLFTLIPVMHNIDPLTDCKVAGKTNDSCNVVYVSCSSHDAGRDTKAACPVGCIACKLCEKACNFDAIHVVDNLAVIDYNKCTSCGACVKACPRKTIGIRS